MAYGDGVFETIRLSAGKTPLWGFHLERLNAGLNTLGIELGNIAWLDNVLSVAHDMPEAILKLIAYRADSARGYYSEQTKADLCVALTPFDNKPASGLTVDVSANALSNNHHLGGIKHLCRLEQVLAAQEAKQRALDELLMLDSQGQLVESISSNLFLYIDKQWYTPSIEGCGVAGVMRRFILEKVSELEVDVRAISLSDLEKVSAAFLSNSVRRVMPIKRIGDKVLDLAPSQACVKTINLYFDA